MNVTIAKKISVHVPRTSADLVIRARTERFYTESAATAEAKNVERTCSLKTGDAGFLRGLALRFERAASLLHRSRALLCVLICQDRYDRRRRGGAGTGNGVVLIRHSLGNDFGETRILAFDGEELLWALAVIKPLANILAQLIFHNLGVHIRPRLLNLERLRDAECVGHVTSIASGAMNDL